MPENRVEAVTVANAAENARLAAVTHQPAEGGWAPPGWMPIAVGLGAAVLVAVGDVLLAGPITLAILGATVLKAAGAFLAGYFGTKSAGPRK